MKFSQVIILLAATLAIVAFGIASAGGLGRLFGKKKTTEQERPCPDTHETADCDLCCRRLGIYKSGKVLVSVQQGFGAIIESERCVCSETDTYTTHGEPEPAWRH